MARTHATHEEMHHLTDLISELEWRERSHVKMLWAARWTAESICQQVTTQNQGK